MRIITGSARGANLLTLEGEETRPTSARAKEAIFSILQFSISGKRVLDLFAGSGQMGLEALSRGADSAVFVDRSPKAVEIIRKNAEKTRLADKCRIECGDFSEKLARLGTERFDIVFLDPPYALGAIPKALSALLRGKNIDGGSYVVCEAGADEDFFGGEAALEAAFDVVRRAKYGVAHVIILQPKEKEL